MDKVSIVTGGSRGIGKSIAKTLCLDNNVIVCSRNKIELEQTKNELKKLTSLEVDTFVCDVSKNEDVNIMVDTVIEKYGRVDSLVNNAGVSFLNKGKRFMITDIMPEAWNKTIAINLTGAFNCSKAVVPHMIRQKSGSIINVSSASARMGGVLAGVDYIASKSGLLGLTKGLAFEVGNYNIRVNAITPGRVATEMNKDADFTREWIKNNIPLQRLGTGDDIADLVSFLVSNKSSYITGSTIDCNGGWVIY